MVVGNPSCRAAVGDVHTACVAVAEEGKGSHVVAGKEDSQDKARRRGDIWARGEEGGADARARPRASVADSFEPASRHPRPSLRARAWASSGPTPKGWASCRRCTLPRRMVMVRRRSSSFHNRLRFHHWTARRDRSTNLTSMAAAVPGCVVAVTSSMTVGILLPRRCHSSNLLHDLRRRPHPHRSVLPQAQQQLRLHQLHPPLQHRRPACRIVP